MADYKETMAKTGAVIHGLCRGVSMYQGKEKAYWSVDVDVKSTKLPVNIRLPESFNRASLQEGELVKISVCFRPAFGGKGLEIHATE